MSHPGAPSVCCTTDWPGSKSPGTRSASWKENRARDRERDHLRDETARRSTPKRPLKVDPASPAAHAILRRMKHARRRCPRCCSIWTRGRGSDHRAAQGRAPHREGPTPSGPRQPRPGRRGRPGSRRSLTPPEPRGGAQGPSPSFPPSGARSGSRRAASGRRSRRTSCAAGRRLRERTGPRAWLHVERVMCSSVDSNASTRARRASSAQVLLDRDRPGPRRFLVRYAAAQGDWGARAAARRGGHDRIERRPRRAGSSRSGGHRGLAPATEARVRAARARRGPRAHRAERRSPRPRRADTAWTSSTPGGATVLARRAPRHC